VYASASLRVIGICAAGIHIRPNDARDTSMHMLYMGRNIIQKKPHTTKSQVAKLLIMLKLLYQGEVCTTVLRFNTVLTLALHKGKAVTSVCLKDFVGPFRG
jgi:hypothetical protein